MRMRHHAPNPASATFTQLIKNGIPVLVNLQHRLVNAMRDMVEKGLSSSYQRCLPIERWSSFRRRHSKLILLCMPCARRLHRMACHGRIAIVVLVVLVIFRFTPFALSSFKLALNLFSLLSFKPFLLSLFSVQSLLLLLANHSPSFLLKKIAARRRWVLARIIRCIRKPSTLQVPTITELSAVNINGIVQIQLARQWCSCTSEQFFSPILPCNLRSQIWTIVSSISHIYADWYWCRRIWCRVGWNGSSFSQIFPFGDILQRRKLHPVTISRLTSSGDHPISTHQFSWSHNIFQFGSLKKGFNINLNTDKHQYWFI